MADEEKPAKKQPAKKAKRRFWRKKRWWTLFLLVAGLVWLDGPGWRWIAQKAASHYLPELGYEVEFEVDGRLSSGELSVSNVSLTGDEAVVKVAGLDSLKVGYLLPKVVRGEVESVILDNLHVDVDLAAVPPKEDEESEPSDPAELLANLRQRLVPMQIELRNISAIIRRGDELLFSIEPTTLLHSPNEDEFELDLGDMELPGGRAIAAQQATLSWTPGELTIDKLKLMDGISVRDVLARFAEGEQPEFGAGIVLDEKRIDVTTDLSVASVILREEIPSLKETAKLFAFELPAEGALHKLDLKVTGIDGGLETLAGELELELGDVAYDDWTAEVLELRATLEGSRADLGLTGIALGAPLQLGAEAELSRSEMELLPTRATANLETPNLERILTAVRDRFTPSDDPVQVPASSLKVNASADFTKGLPSAARAELAIVSSVDAPPVSIDATWNDSQEITAAVRLPAVEIDGGFALEAKTYEGTASLDSFTPSSLRAWLQPFGIEVPDGILATLDWEGSGDLEQNRHQGKLEINGAEWKRDEDSDTLKAFASAEYAWPESVKLAPLNVQLSTQKIETRAELSDRTLTLEQLEWSDADEVLASGNASIPVPEDLSDWKALLRETRPIELKFETPELPLSKLHPFLPESSRFVDSSRAKLSIHLTGSPANPELDTNLTALELGLVSQPDVPLANIELEAVGKEKTLKLEGEVTAPGYPPAVISAVTNWDPDQWAEDPDTVKAASLDARLTLTDLNIATLGSFLPKTKKLSGEINAMVEVTGTVGEPAPRAEVTLDGGAFEMHDPGVPRVSKGALRVTATPAEVNLENLSAEVSGGTLVINGGIKLNDGKPGDVNLAIDAKSLPAVRNESMIVRISSDLKVGGPWETARISGGIKVVDSLFFKDIELLPIGVPVNKVAEPSLPAIDAPPPSELAAKVPAPFNDWSLDVSLKTGSPFLIRGNLANGEVYVDARIGGAVGTPRPSGEIKLREIEAKLPFSTLEIDAGKITLRPDHPFDPVLDIRGTSRIRPYDVTIYIYGPVSDPNIQPTSSPPLAETEVMTLIATGTTTRGFEDPSAATARATQLLIEEARRGRIGAVKVLRPVFKVLDKVDFQVGEVDPYTSKKYNSATFNLDDNWLLTAGISDEGNTRTKVTYLLRFE
ncbi:translocation/assembly module TamB [Haloferula helveola]|uniref:Translocation/assembly module TamB n=1 Tax=Haloferula helveola TaxID=490095 RepID=A0ABN6HEY8_9BACT|nr:translocation/assembly module TamB [Haloferula helveola]